MIKCTICEKDIRNKESMIILARGLFGRPKPYHEKCYLKHQEDKGIFKKKMRLVSNAALYMALSIQGLLAVLFGFMLFNSEPGSTMSLIAFPLALLIVVMIAEVVQRVHGYIMYEKPFDNGNAKTRR